jgi:uncharacterized protein YkwD
MKTRIAWPCLFLCLVLPACAGDSTDPETDAAESEDTSGGGRPTRPDADGPERDAGSVDDATDDTVASVEDVASGRDAATSDAGTRPDPDPRPDTGTADTAGPAPDVTPADTGVSEPDPSGPGLDCDASDVNRYACCVFEQVNLYRERNGLSAYQWNTGLSEAGFYYADYMARNRVFAHSADGMNVGQRLDEYDVAWASAGENLQRNDLSNWSAACNETVNGRGGWANSRSGHREAMLGQDASGVDKRWTHAAAGVARNGNDWYVAMYFVRF